jgi:hypothetical protein
VEHYFRALGITDDDEKINFTLGQLQGSAFLWRMGYTEKHITNPPANHQPQTWAQFTTDLEQAFAQDTQAHQSGRHLKDIRQNGRYIETYISEFSNLAVQAGLTDDTTAVRIYFEDGLDPDIRFEALRQRPQTLEQWKQAARDAYRIHEAQLRTRSTNGSNYGRHRTSTRYTKSYKKGKGKSNKRHNPRYVDIQSQPILPQFQQNPRRSEYDMDIDFYREQCNEVDGDDSSEEEPSSQEEESSDEEISLAQTRKSDRSINALSHLINNILTDDQRASLRNGECFFCHKQGHFYRDCKAWRNYINSSRKKPVDRKQSKKPNNRPQKSKGKFTPKKKKPVDPNAMVYNFEEDEEEPSDNEDF